LCGWAAFAVPLSITLLRLSPAAQWRDDLSVVRGLGLVPVGGEGACSTFAMQLASLLPLGGRLTRAALASALGLAGASLVAYRIARRLLEANGDTPVLGPCLGLGAALMATLSPTWQLEGTIAGGATLAAGLVLVAPLIRPAPRPLEAREWMAVGALVALCGAECHAAGLAALVAALAQALGLLELPSRRALRLFAASALVVTVVCLMPVFIRPWAGRGWVTLGWSVASRAAPFPAPPAAEAGVLGAWLSDPGVATLVLAALGLGWGLARARTRWLVAPLAAFVLLDFGLGWARPGAFGPHVSGPVRLCALAALSMTAALSVHTIVLGLGHAKLPFARAAQVLLVVLLFVLVTVSAEDSSYVADRHARYAAEAWTDAALSALPSRSFLLVRSEALAWRIWAARVVRGERPDLVVAPMSLIDGPAFARRLVALEPAAGAVVRDVTVRGRPSEFALSTLADARPLVVELDPSWDHRLLEHLVPEPFWLGFSAHPLGRSDRALYLARGRDAFRRVLEVANSPTERDPATLAVLAAECQGQAATFAALGDRDGALGVLGDLKTIDPKAKFLVEIEQRFARRPRGGIELGGLIQ
jgi:hypothetical protein